MRRPFALLSLLLLTACGAEPTPEATEPAAEFTLLSLEAGDVACYATLRDAAGEETLEYASFEVCERSELIGARVWPTFIEAQVLADSCAGDPDCGESKTVRLVDRLEALDPAEGSAPQAAGATIPFFESRVGHREQAVAFHRFLEEHEGERVDLDLELEVEAFQDEGATFFALWVECEDLPPGDAPSALACWGIEVQARGYEQGAGTLPHLRGRFEVGAFAGPHQGLFAAPLEYLGP